MQIQAKQEGPRSEAPPTGLLQLEMSVNVTDTHLLKNLRAVKELGVPELPLMVENTKTLAICGSGPSLQRTWGLIPPDAEVLALNGAYKFLCGKGRIPEYFAMLDSRRDNRNFVDTPYKETTFLLASQCDPDIVDGLDAEFLVGLFHLNTPTTRQVFPEAELYVGGGGTIGLTSLTLALALGYRKFILYGFDSSYEDEKRHVTHQPQNDKEKTIDVWVEGRKYTTSMAMAAQVMDFFPLHAAIRQKYPDITLDIIGDGLFYDFVTTNNKPASRSGELSKYEDAYLQPDYGMTLQRAKGITVLLSQLTDCESYLDVSTGRGESLDIARQLGFKRIKGTETVPALLSTDITFAVLPEVPHPDKSFDVVSLFEVIEHLLPEDIKPALDELTRLAKKHILISAAVREHWIGGVNLHPSAMPVEDWEKIFTAQWGDRVYRVSSLGSSPCWRVDL